MTGQWSGASRTSSLTMASSRVSACTPDNDFISMTEICVQLHDSHDPQNVAGVAFPADLLKKFTEVTTQIAGIGVDRTTPGFEQSGQ
ncbi:hypothetical protein [Streptomyces sp. RTd22]|uniref:hypothetical protein n=1 Tax=Streptomyces sp. RTd22 TaxID=1841249 RepID=UPI00131AC872|nr:hypothetical protein [Streptomyces sp. RTd22]